MQCGTFSDFSYTTKTKTRQLMTHLQGGRSFPDFYRRFPWFTKVFILEKTLNRAGPSTSHSRGTKATKGGKNGGFEKVCQKIQEDSELAKKGLFQMISRDFRTLEDLMILFYEFWSRLERVCEKFLKRQRTRLVLHDEWTTHLTSELSRHPKFLTM